MKTDNVAIKAATGKLRENMHGLRNDLNRDLGAVVTRVARLEKAEETTGDRMARMEDKLDEILVRLPRA